MEFLIWGAFTLSWETNGENSQRLMIRRRGKPYWTSGHLNNQTFEFTKFTKVYMYNLSSAYNNEERYFSYYGSNGHTPMWILNANGQIVEGDHDELLKWSPEFCYGYDSGNGCMAVSLPPCRSIDDKFTLLTGEFASSGFLAFKPDYNSRISFSDCMMRCWDSCDCLGFNSGENGAGCNIWEGDAEFEINPQSFSVPKYVLVSPKKGKIIVFDVMI
ncbi:putative PAN/Apple domain-containing protein [Helianthus debilis subsp. tardiflorus]